MSNQNKYYILNHKPLFSDHVSESQISDEHVTVSSDSTPIVQYASPSATAYIADDSSYVVSADAGDLVMAATEATPATTSANTHHTVCIR